MHIHVMSFLTRELRARNVIAEDSTHGMDECIKVCYDSFCR